MLQQFNYFDQTVGKTIRQETCYFTVSVRYINVYIYRSAQMNYNFFLTKIG